MFSLLLLLFAMGSTAQIVDPIEQSYGPYTRPSTGYEPALAVSRTGVLLAWSEVDASSDLPQIRVGLLDFSGRLVSPITTIASTGRADLPSVASDGNGFRVAFVELRKESRGMRRYTMSVDFDAAGRRAGEPQQLGGYEPYESSFHPLLYWNGLSFALVHRTDAEAVAIVNADLARAGWTREAVWFGIPGDFSLDSFELWWWINPVKGKYRLRLGERAGPIAIAGDGNRASLAWHSDAGVSYLELTDGAVSTAPILFPASVFLEERLALGCDDTHCLVAYATKSRQIYGALLERGSRNVAVPVPIELASSVTKPQVHVLRNGRFLVTYISLAVEPQDRFAGRIVTTAASPRRRAVR